MLVQNITKLLHIVSIVSRYYPYKEHSGVRNEARAKNVFKIIRDPGTKTLYRRDAASPVLSASPIHEAWSTAARPQWTNLGHGHF